jgi:hypothetical protein
MLYSKSKNPYEKRSGFALPFIIAISVGSIHKRATSPSIINT